MGEEVSASDWSGTACSENSCGNRCSRTLNISILLQHTENWTVKWQLPNFKVQHSVEQVTKSPEHQFIEWALWPINWRLQQSAPCVENWKWMEPLGSGIFEQMGNCPTDAWVMNENDKESNCREGEIRTPGNCLPSPFLLLSALPPNLSFLPPSIPCPSLFSFLSFTLAPQRAHTLTLKGEKCSSIG